VHGPIRFSELKTRLDVSSATLSARLSELVEVGFVERTSYDEIPPRVEYTGTESLKEFKPIFGHLVDWAERHEFGPVAEEPDTDAGADTTDG
jgi:DNA-binding HxlR family transcriptional regulator